MGLDEVNALLVRSELEATGATIHDIRNLRGGIRSSLSLLANGPCERLPQEYLDWVETALTSWCNQLAAILQHGDGKKARRDFPTLPYPKEFR